MSLPPLPRRRIERVLWSVLEEHFEDAQYLFLRWEAGLDSSEDNLRSLAAGPELRFAAHVRGLVHGGMPVVERLLFPAIRAEGAEEAFDERAQRATAALAILSQPSGGTERLIAAASEEIAPESAEHLHRAMQLWDTPAADAALYAASLRTREESWPAWLRTFAIRGQAADDKMVNTCLRGERDAILAGLRVVPGMRATAGERVHDVLAYFLSHEDAELRVAALRASLELGSHRAWAMCREWARSPAAPAGVFELIGMVGNAEDHAGLVQQVVDGHLSEARVWALGLSGRPHAAHLCMQLLEHADDRIARLAFEAFCAITGLPGDNPKVAEVEPRPGVRDLAEPDGDFAKAEAERDAAVEADLAEGRDVVVRSLPKAKPDAVKAWWAEASSYFDPKQRYFLGRVATQEVMRAIYVDGPSRRRHSLAYELTLRTRSHIQASSRAFARRQYRQLEALAGLRVDPQRGYLDI